MDFPRRSSHMGQLKLTAMIDIMFILITFFMLTTTFMKIESMELVFPGEGEDVESVITPVFITIRTDAITYKNNVVSSENLQDQLAELLTEKPDTTLMLLTSKEVSLQRLVSTMDVIYLAGGQNVMIQELVE